MNYGDSLKLVALRNVIKQDGDDYNLRFIFRWFSEKFHVPLHLVERLPLHEVLLNYWERVYEEMKDEDRQKELAELIESEEERFARFIKEDFEDVEREEFAKIAAEEEERRFKKKRKAQKFAEVVKLDPNAPRPLRPAPVGEETDLPTVKAPRLELPPDITMTFVDELPEEELDGPGKFNPPKKDRPGTILLP